MSIPAIGVQSVPVVHLGLNSDGTLQVPTQRVYGPISYAGIRLVTCGGAFDHSTGHYVDNIVVFGHMVGVSR